MFRKIFPAAAVFALIAMLPAGAAMAQKNPGSKNALHEQRVALVIGNAAYAGSPLRNPVNDARGMADKLQRLGFKVVKRENMRTREIGPTLREFRSQLSPGAVALFFYAGHGMQVKGVNYLPTVDAVIEGEEDVPSQSLDVNKVVEVMEESKARVNLVFLDACRDNPYARSFRSASRGLSRIDASSGILISFATRPGSVAADGNGENGLYTEYLLKHMDDANLPIEQMLKRVGASVKAASKGRQEPWSEGLIEGDFYFRIEDQEAATAVPVATARPVTNAAVAPPAPVPRQPQPQAQIQSPSQPSEPIDWNKKAAEGDPSERLYAALVLRDMHREGRGVEKSLDEAAKWARRAESEYHASALSFAEVKSVRVDAAADWLDTGVDLQGGEVLRVTAEGEWSMGIICGKTGPDGKGAGFLCTADYLAIGATGSSLIGRVGASDANAFPVGSFGFARGEEGRLYLRAYDAIPGDNSGSVTARIARLRGR